MATSVGVAGGVAGEKSIANRSMSASLSAEDSPRSWVEVDCWDGGGGFADWCCFVTTAVMSSQRT